MTPRESPIRPGDRYLRHGNPPGRWVVERLLERDGHPLHVRLVQEGYRRTITVAASVLEDTRQFKQLRED